MRDWPRHNPPALAQFQELANRAFDELPEGFKALCGNVVIHVAEQAEQPTLDYFGIKSPLGLSGLFEGVSINHRSVADPYALPNHVHLYRRAIIAEWRSRADVTLMELITHVLVHEIGHHFGLSDDDIDRIEQS